MPQAPEPATTCRGIRRAATDFLDGRLPAAQRDPIQAHLRECAGCRDFYQDFVALGARARRAADAAPDVAPGPLAERVLDAARRRRSEILRELDDGLSSPDSAREAAAVADEAPQDRVAAGLATWIAIVVAATAVAGFLIGRWSAPARDAGPTVHARPDVDAPLPGDPHRLRQREDHDAPPDEVIESDPGSDPGPTTGVDDDPADLHHVLTGDR